MISFSSDYTKGAHPKILKRLMDDNLVQNPGYGTDDICKSAADKIKNECGCPQGDVFFLVGGTQTNQTIIDILLKPYEGVVAAQTGHVAAHEAGAIEFSGHKVLTINAHNQRLDVAEGEHLVPMPDNAGKIDAKELSDFIRAFYDDDNHEHMVFPGAVYISHPTEYGTLYTRKEMADISAVCKEFQIPLFVDGARLGYGLMSLDTDVTIKDIAEYADVFYIGGTKVGALFGEAVVFPKGVPSKHPIPVIKQHGALLAKGWLLGTQFDTLFTDGLYYEISKNAIDMAELLKQALREKNYRFFLNSPTNQQFVIVDNDKLKEFEGKVGYGFWEKFDDEHTVIRFATDWATTQEDIEELKKFL